MHKSLQKDVSPNIEGCSEKLQMARAELLFESGFISKLKFTINRIRDTINRECRFFCIPYL